MTTETKDQPAPWATLATLPAETLARDLWTQTQRAERAEKRAHEAERRATVATLALGESLVTDAAIQSLVTMTEERNAARREADAANLRLALERQLRADERAAEAQLRARFPIPGVEIAVAGGAIGRV